MANTIAAIIFIVLGIVYSCLTVLLIWHLWKHGDDFDRYEVIPVTKDAHIVIAIFLAIFSALSLLAGISILTY